MGDVRAGTERDGYEVVIVGGGPAGLSAALVLGRCRRKVLLIDAGRPRNRRASGVNGLLTREGTPPAELLAIGRDEVARYGVEREEGVVTAAQKVDGGFVVQTEAGRRAFGKKLLVATGVEDFVPEAPGFRDLWGKAVFPCPYCDGWEMRDRRLGAYARDDGELGLSLLTWSDDVTLFTDGAELAAERRELLAKRGVAVRQAAIASLEHDGERLAAVRLADGERVPCDAIFVQAGEAQAAPFALELGAEPLSSGAVRGGKGERAGPPGMFVAGDASQDLQLVAIAIAEGVKAACAINRELREERHG